MMLKNNTTLEGYSVREHIHDNCLGALFSGFSIQGNQSVFIQEIAQSKHSHLSSKEWEKFFFNLAGELEHQHPSLIPYLEIIHKEKNLTYLISKNPNPILEQKHLTLEDLLAETPEHRLDEREAIDIFKQLLEGIWYLHRERLIHGFLNPRCIILEKKKEHLKAHLMNYGFFPFCRPHEEKRLSFYIAPELRENPRQEILPIHDIYSLGALFWQMLTGDNKHQFNDPTTAELNSPFPKLPKLHEITLELLQKTFTTHREQRFQTPTQALDLLKTFYEISQKDYDKNLKEIEPHPSTLKVKTPPPNLLKTISYDMPNDEEALAQLQEKLIQSQKEQREHDETKTPERQLSEDIFTEALPPLPPLVPKEWEKELLQTHSHKLKRHKLKNFLFSLVLFFLFFAFLGMIIVLLRSS